MNPTTGTLEDRILDLIDPWLHASPERLSFRITEGPRTIDVRMPLAAAVEVERAGYNIRAV